MKKFKIIFVLLISIIFYGMAQAGEFSFAVVSDIHKARDSWRNTLQELSRRDVDLILVAGDMAPDLDRYIDYEETFYMGNKIPVLLPVAGNHEIKDGKENYDYLVKDVLPQIKGAVRADQKDSSYYYDHQNCRFIAVDAYNIFGRYGMINDAGREWVSKVIVGAPEGVENIFIFFHEPAYPQFRHVGDSFDEDPVLRDKFWQMLAGYGDKVKAVFCGHTHYYYRAEYQGIWQISSGSIGNNRETSFVVVNVSGSRVDFQAFHAENGPDKPFTPLDTWADVNSLTSIP